MGVCLLAFCVGIIAFGKFEMGIGDEELRTLTFLTLVFGSQATIYVIREHRRFWGPRPSSWLVASSVADVLIASTLAVEGFGMAPLPAASVAATLGASVAFAVVLNLVKVPVFVQFRIA